MPAAPSAASSVRPSNANKVSRAREELVAELGAAFLCGRFHLTTALRPDHAQSVASWMSVLGDSRRQQAFFWAAREAEQTVEYVTRLGDVACAEVDGGIPSHLAMT